MGGSRAFDVLVYIGRFQPLHHGHLAVMRAALERAEQLMVVFGSAQAARNSANPLNSGERAAMLLQAFAPTDPELLARIGFCALRDDYHEARWVRTLQQSVLSQLSGTERVGLIAASPARRNFYRIACPEWSQLELPWPGSPDSAAIRDRYFAPGPLADKWPALAELLPAASLAALRRLSATPDYSVLHAEYFYLQRERLATAGEGAPRISAEGLLRCQDKVLMVQRSERYGYGLWALPGVTVSGDERLVAAAERALGEIVTLAGGAAALTACLAERAVFDQPGRSLLGRSISHVSYFNLGQRPLPALREAAQCNTACWVPIEQLRLMAPQLFADHFCLIDHFIPLL